MTMPEGKGIVPIGGRQPELHSNCKAIRKRRGTDILLKLCLDSKKADC